MKIIQTCLRNLHKYCVFFSFFDLDFIYDNVPSNFLGYFLFDKFFFLRLFLCGIWKQHTVCVYLSFSAYFDFNTYKTGLRCYGFTYSIPKPMQSISLP